MNLSKVYRHPFVERLLRLIPDEQYISLMYRKNVGSWPNLKNPTTFTEKLQWLKLYYHKPEFCTMVDKLAVKEYVANKIGSEYVIPTYEVWEKPSDIILDNLPDQFVLKWNHDSGSVIICLDKSHFNLEKAKQKLAKGARKNGFWYGREWPYKGVKPYIIAEKFVEDKDHPGDLKDYKFFCFNGKVEVFKIDFNRFIDHHANYYSPKGELLHFGESVCPPVYNHEEIMPSNLAEMIFLAEKLSADIPFLRVDFYNCQNKILFGELTFYPASGFERFTSNQWDKKLGDMLTLPIVTYNQH